jgi:biotin operon repressor
MSLSTSKINSVLVDIKTMNNSLLLRLQQSGFDSSQLIGSENEYSVKSLLHHIDALALQFLTITANREQFIQRTSHQERLDIHNHLRNLYICLKQTHNTLDMLSDGNVQIDLNNQLSKPLAYLTEQGAYESLILVKAVDYIEALKPYGRMLDLVIAQQRIHALSAVLETLLFKEQATASIDMLEDHGLTEEQANALELSRYLIKQAM